MQTKHCRVYALGDITSANHGQGVGKNGFASFYFQGEEYKPGKGIFKTHEAGMQRLEKSARIGTTKNNIGYIRYFNDFTGYPINNIWTDTLGQNQFGGEKIYVVQTGLTIIKRCLLMTTDPGDLVLDPTCGSGTTAYVAEQWGRRWPVPGSWARDIPTTSLPIPPKGR
jgi:adenine-specific DNA-methyltransferase